MEYGSYSMRHAASAGSGRNSSTSPSVGVRLQQARDGAKARRDAARADGVLQQAERQVRHIEATLEQVRRELGPAPPSVPPRTGTAAHLLGDSLAALRAPPSGLRALERSAPPPELARPVPSLTMPAAPGPQPCGAERARADLAAAQLRAARLPPPPPSAAVSPPGDFRMHSPGQSPLPQQCRAPTLPAARVPTQTALSAGAGTGPALPAPPGGARSEKARAIQQKMAELERRIAQHAQEMAHYQESPSRGSPVRHPAAAPAPAPAAAPQPPPALPPVSSVAPEPVGPPGQWRGVTSPSRPPPAPASPPRSAPRSAGDATPPRHRYADAAGGVSPISINADDLAAMPAREREERRWERLREAVAAAPPDSDAAHLRGCRRLLQLRAEYLAEEQRVQTAELGLLLERKLFRDKLQRVSRTVAERADGLAARQRAGEQPPRDEMIFLNAVGLVLRQAPA
eukprot:TRINITY_DN5338_c0_g1_i1.p1 TRINITY_DN5338_c0_g1~~TRINITY_DN5338_c0_g1_i1.p1  ORF type:complete len:486 (+),score=133.53 TRINITY_DN5338_c0_g1_i1:89-1459(+)